MPSATSTTDHETIRRWVESRGGCPAHVKGSGSRDDPGILRIDYPGFSGRTSLEKISWKKFFDAFEANQLAFIYQDQRGSRFSKLVRRDHGPAQRERAATRAGRGKGARGAAEAEAGPDALQFLEQQHREVERFIEQLKSARNSGQKERGLERVANALAAHTKLEETIFYPAVFGTDTERLLRESVEEHLIAKRLLSDLMKMEPSDPQFMSKVTVLEEVVRQHVEEEEHELFPQVRDSGEDLGMLGRSMQKRYRELIQDEPAQALPRETRAAVVQF